MITIELTQTQIDHLTEGAEQFGRCSMVLETSDGDPVFVVLTKVQRRGRPRKPAETAGEADPAPECLAERPGFQTARKESSQ